MSIVRRIHQASPFVATETADARGKLIELSTDSILLGLEIRLHGTIAVANNAGAAAGNALLALNLLQKISLEGDASKEYLSGCDFAQLARRGYIWTGVNCIVNTAVSVATHTVDIKAFVPFTLRNPHYALGPEAVKFGLNSTKHRRLTLFFDQKALNTAITPNAAGDLTEALTVTCVGIYDTALPTDVSYNQIVHRGTAISHAATGTGNRSDLRQQAHLRSIYLDAFDNTIASDAVIGNLDLSINRDGKDIHPFKDDFEELQKEQDGRFGIAHLPGGLFEMLDNGHGRGLEDMRAATAELIPTITTVTATSETKAILEVVEMATVQG